MIQKRNEEKVINFMKVHELVHYAQCFNRQTGSNDLAITYENHLPES